MTDFITPAQANAALWLIAHDVVDTCDIKEEPGWCLYVNLNDVFAPAADAEEFKPYDAIHLKEIYQQYGHTGVYAWAATRQCFGTPWRKLHESYPVVLDELRAKQAKTGYCMRVFASPQDVPKLTAGQKLRGFIVKDGDWWLGYCKEIDQAAQGKTRADVLIALQEVVMLFVESITKDKLTITNDELLPGDWWHTTVEEKK